MASLFYTVSLAAVGGFWGGDFAFAPDGTLYLSSGNIVGASVYRVVGGVPTVFFTDPTGNIAGFDFDALGSIYYADWFNRIYQVTPAAVRSVVLDIPGRRFSDVAVLARSIALGPEAGRVNGVAFHPTSPQILYAASSTGGIFRTYDGGQNWFLRTRGVTNPQTDGLLVHPTAPSMVFAATPAGVFRSTDEGLSWAQVLPVTPPLPPPSLPLFVRGSEKNPMRYDPLDGSLYAAPFCAGLYRSPDGVQWTPRYPTGPVPAAESCVTSIDVSPASGGLVYITTPSGIRQRVGGAGPWTQIGTEINDADPLVLRVAPSDPNRLYVAATKLNTWPLNTNVWVRATAGGTFVRTTVMPPWLPWFSAQSLTVHPTDALRLYFGSVALYKTTDAANWSLATCANSEICGVDYRGVAFDPTGNRLYAPHDQGIYRLDLATNTLIGWLTYLVCRFLGLLCPSPTAIENGLVNTQFYDIDVGPGGTLYGGTQDTGAYRRPAGDVWQGIPSGGSGDVLDLLAHPTDPLRLFIRTNTEHLLRSTDGGKSSSPSQPLPSQGFWNHQLAYDAATTTVYAGTQFRGVYKSTDDGGTFAPANTGIATLEIRCLALQPGSRAAVVYAGTFTRGVYKTTDGGATWSALSAFPEAGALVLAFNPTATRLYAGTKGGVYLSTDGGNSWSNKQHGTSRDPGRKRDRGRPRLPLRALRGARLLRFRQPVRRRCLPERRRRRELDSIHGLRRVLDVGAFDPHRSPGPLEALHRDLRLGRARPAARHHERK